MRGKRSSSYLLLLCSLGLFADQWLQNQFGGVFNDLTVMQKTLFVVTYDEGALNAN